MDVNPDTGSGQVGANGRDVCSGMQAGSLRYPSSASRGKFYKVVIEPGGESGRVGGFPLPYPMTSAEPPSAKIGHYRWLVCALLFFATTINYFDRQILGLLKPVLEEQLHFSNTQYGYINSAFQGAYGLSLLGFGWLVDRFGTKIGYAVSILVWGMGALGHALVGSLAGLMVARVAVGIGEGGNFPSAIKATALWFPKKERALATSIFNSGANVGPILAPMIVPLIALNWGWHWDYILIGLVAFLWLLFWLPLYNVPEKIPSLDPKELAFIRSDAPEASHDGEKIAWLSLLGYRQTWSFIMGKFLTDPIWWFFLTWLPDYFNKSRALDIKGSRQYLITIYAIVTVLSIAGGWLTGHLVKGGWTVTRARKTGMFLFAACVVPIFWVTSPHVDNWTAVCLIGLAGAAHQAWSANLFTTVSDMFPKRAIGSVIGIGGLAGAAGGMMFPILTGKLLDAYKGDSTAGYTILFSICAFAYLLAFGIHHMLAPRFEPFRMKEA